MDEYIIMPNHIHGIIVITCAVGAKNFSPRINQADNNRANNYLPLQRQPGTSKTIGSIVRGFKIGVTKWMRQNTDVERVWQRNYYEHIIRQGVELEEKRKYIRENPSNWDTDEENR